jgi:hypothetical protein
VQELNWYDQLSTVKRGFAVLSPVVYFFYLKPASEKYHKFLVARREELGIQDAYLQLKVRKTVLSEEADFPGIEKQLADIEDMMDRYNKTAAESRSVDDRLTQELINQSSELLSNQERIEKELD